MKNLAAVLALFLLLSPLHADGIFNGGSGGGGGSGTVTQVNTGCGATGGPITTSGTIQTQTLVRANTGTTDTILAADCGGRVTESNASAVAVALPQAGGSFPAGYTTEVVNLGAGTVTITPATSTINGAATLTLAQFQSAEIVSDGTNYSAALGKGAAPGGSSGDVQTNNGSGGFAGGTALSSLAPLASPTFTGTPAAPTPGTNVNTTQIPTSAWVNTYFAALAAGNAFTGANSWSIAGQAFNAVGSTTAPTIVGGGCGTQCGFYWPATGKWGLTIGGTTVLDYAITTAGAFTMGGNLNLNFNSLSNVAVIGGSGNLSILPGNTAGNTASIATRNAATGAAAGAVNITGGNGTAGTVGGGNIVMTPGTSSGGTAGTIQFVNIGSAVGTNFVCWNSSGNIVSQGATCGVSIKEMKNSMGFIEATHALVAINSLPNQLPVWNYKFDKAHTPHVGLYADDVEKMDPRCAIYEKGKLRNYEDRCVIAYLTVAVQEQQKEIEYLKRRVH